MDLQYNTPTITADNSFWYRGTADAMIQKLNFLKSSHEPYVVIASGDGVYKLDFNKVLEYHIAKRADITVVCTDVYGDDTTRFGCLKMNEDSRIEEFEEKPMVTRTNPRVKCWAADSVKSLNFLKTVVFPILGTLQF